MKNAKGTIDYDPEMMARISNIVNIIRQNALNLGASEIDTPCIELTQVLMDKYGEEAENKLIYKLQDLSHQELALRYDLTVPLQRYLMAHGLESMDRFQVGKVFRKDQPGKGRLREFMQADMDLVGVSEPMIQESKIMKLIVSSLDQIGFKEYVIRINFRQNLADMVERAKIDPKLFKDVCISIDKMDKHPWEYIAKELKEDRGLSKESIASLKKDLDDNYMSNNVELIHFLKSFHGI